MPEHHISSVLVSARPAAVAAVAAAIAALPGAEVCHVEGARIIAVLEGPDRDILGGLLTRIALLDDVLAANLVFEHVEPFELQGDDP
jgi:nitrate reductase NapD